MINSDNDNALRASNQQLRAIEQQLRASNQQLRSTEQELRSTVLRQTAILASVPDIIMEVDQNKVYTWSNEAGRTFFGQDVVGHNADYYFEGEQDIYSVVQPLFEGNENIIYVESWQKRADGEKRLLAWWCRVLKDQNGKIKGALSTARDITAWKQAETELLLYNKELRAAEQQLIASNEQLRATDQQLRASNQQLRAQGEALKKSESDYRALFREMQTGCAVHEIICDKKGTPVDYRFLHVNPMWEQMTGLQAKDVIGKTVREVIPNIEQHWIDTFGKVALTGKSIKFEEHAAPLGKHFEGSAFSPHENCFAVTFSDITERKHREKSILIQKELSQKLNLANDVQEALKACLDAAIDITSLDSGGAYLLDEVTGDMDLVHHRGLSDKFTSTASHYNNDSHRVALVKKGIPVYLSHHDIQSEGNDLIRHEGLTTLGIIPISFEGYATACLNIASHKQENISETDRHILETMASQAGEIILRLNTENKLRESQETYKTLFENAAEGILVADIEKKQMIFGNPEIQRMLGYNNTEIPKLKLSDLHPAEHLEYVAKEFEAQARGEKVLAVNIPFQRKDGTIFYTDVRTTPVKIGSRLCNLGLITDATTRREVEKQKEQLVQTEKLASLGTLVAGIAHEINNPNTFIMLNAPNLQDIWEDILPALEEYCHDKNIDHIGHFDLNALRELPTKLLSDIIGGSQRIKSIVGELKTFARQDDADMSSIVNINDVAQSAVALIWNKIKNSTNNFITEYSENLPLMQGNYQRLEQVIINILGNACEALTDKGKSIKLSTTCDEDKTIIIVRVQDEGIGIPKEIMKEIRDPFFTTKRKSGGTGLGLSISSQIMLEHGGALSLDSQPGTGTMVTIVLPAHLEDAHVDSII